MTIPALCTHVHASGATCQSPAVRGTALCYHHSALKLALDQVAQIGTERAVRAPIPFVFAEDRASLQINYALLLQALNEHRLHFRTVNIMLRILRAMEHNLGQSPLAETSNSSTDTPTITSIVSIPAPRAEYTDLVNDPPPHRDTEEKPSTARKPAPIMTGPGGRELTKTERMLTEYFGGFDKIPDIYFKNGSASRSEALPAATPARRSQSPGAEASAAATPTHHRTDLGSQAAESICPRTSS